MNSEGWTHDMARDPLYHPPGCGSTHVCDIRCPHMVAPPRHSSQNAVADFSGRKWMDAGVRTGASCCGSSNEGFLVQGRAAVSSFSVNSMAGLHASIHWAREMGESSESHGAVCHTGYDVVVSLYQ